MIEAKIGKKREKSVFREYFELIVETAVFVFFVMTFVVQAFQIPTGSMETTLRVGDFLLVNKLVYAHTISSFEEKILPRKAIRRQDIVVFKYPEEPNKDFVKRVIGLPGDKLEIINKQVFINDKPLDENYKRYIDSNTIYAMNFSEADWRQGRYRTSANAPVDYRDNFGPIHVLPDDIFVMGDNRDNSYDSRYWALVPLTSVKGRPWVIYFSYDADTNTILDPSIKARMRRFFSFITKARLGRMFKIIH
jgi:signal peptidase I